MVGKSFPCREDLHLSVYLQKSHSCLGFIFVVVFIHNGPLQEMGLPFFGPWIWIRQAHLTGPVRPHFYPLQELIEHQNEVRRAQQGREKDCSGHGPGIRTYTSVDFS